MIGYISQGKLVLNSTGAENEVSSDFVRDLKKRLQSVEDRSSVFRGGSGSAFMGGGLPMPEQPTLDETFHAEFSCAASGVTPGQICYAVDARQVRGLFIYNPEEKYERRVFHGPEHRFTAISVRDEEDGPVWLVAACQNHGASRIGIFQPDAGGGVREVTEGDSLDSYPVWIPGDTRRFAYQTSGVARHHHTGDWMGLGPASIQSIDLETGDMEALAENDNFDFLCPAYGPDGSLYYLRRPYEPFRNASPWRILQDIVLFPFRLFRAILGFLDIFSMVFTGKPIQTAGAPQRKDAPDPKAVFLYGRWVNVEKAMKDAADEEANSAIPKNWELVRRDPEGSTKTLVHGVMAFALDSEGRPIYSNGRGVFQLNSNDSKKPKKISNRKMVTAIFAE